MIQGRQLKSSQILVHSTSNQQANEHSVEKRIVPSLYRSPVFRVNTVEGGVGQTCPHRIPEQLEQRLGDGTSQSKVVGSWLWQCRRISFQMLQKR